MEHRADSDAIGFIGGAVDPTETVVQAATREVFEETGLRIEDPTFVGLITDPSRIAAYPDGNVIATMTAMFIAHTTQPELTPSAESRALVWVPWDDVDVDRLPRLHVPLLIAAQQWRRDGIVRAQ